MSYTQENATLQEAMEALDKGAIVSWGGIMARKHGVMLQSRLGGEWVRWALRIPKELTGWSIVWGGAPECDDCKNFVNRGCMLSTRDIQYKDPRKHADYCGHTCKWFAAREKEPDAEYEDLPVFPCPHSPFFKVMIGCEPWRLDKVSSHKKFLGYIYEGEDTASAQPIKWLGCGDLGSRVVRPVAVRMRKGKK